MYGSISAWREGGMGGRTDGCVADRRAGGQTDRSIGRGGGRGLTDADDVPYMSAPALTHSILWLCPSAREICRLEGGERANKRSGCFRNRNSCSRSPNLFSLNAPSYEKSVPAAAADAVVRTPSRTIFIFTRMLPSPLPCCNCC